MPRPHQRPPTPNRRSTSPTDEAPAPEAEPSPLSLSRLREAFAQMLGADAGAEGDAAAEATTPTSRGAAAPRSERPADAQQHAAADPCEISPRSVVEAMLFVGRPNDEPLSARELAAAMRGVSPAEIDAAVAELNQIYERDAAPYAITGSAEGYRLALRDEFRRMRDKYYGRLKEARLSSSALEVLSVVAYNQPTTAEAVSELRGTPSGPALASLVRRQLVRVDRPDDRREPPRYSTTDRFLRLFGLESVAALPRDEELEKI